jgi:NitT/TauT family transport system substrate-binding protein
MHRRPAEGLSRREFLGGLVLAGAAGLLGLKPEPVAADPPPETTTIRLWKTPVICVAPQYLAEELLKAEGFTDVQYIDETAEASQGLAAGRYDLGMAFVAPALVTLDAGLPIVFLAGIHAGCLEVFGTEQVQTLRDLKGKTVAVFGLGSPMHVFLASMLAYVGLDPNKDVNWDTHPPAEAIQLFAQEQIDALIVLPPGPQRLREQKIGHVIVSTTLDRPWSQYFCCMVLGHREFVQQYPIATKRALRAILKAANLCVLQPEHAAHLLVDKAFAQRYDYALQAMQEIPYNSWREYDPEDSVRFYALRLHEIGMIKSSPQKIIAAGTDWRFLNEIKKELKE